MSEAHTPSCCDPDVDPRTVRRFDALASEWTDTEEFPLLVPISAHLLDLLPDAALERPTVLELGCGTGGLSVALAEAGARQVTGIDISGRSVEVARARAARSGREAETRFEVGDAARMTHAPHDWVVMDRLVCCYADAERLMVNAVRAARHRIAVSVPESRGWRGLVNRPLWAAENVWDLLHDGCRGYVHDVRRLERQLAAAGFARRRSARSGLWYAGVYERS